MKMLGITKSPFVYKFMRKFDARTVARTSLGHQVGDARDSPCEGPRVR